MKKLLNTLYVLTPESYLYCRNENICVKIGGVEKQSIPAISIDGVVCFGQMTVSTPLIEFCGRQGITITFLSQNGRFFGRVCGPVSGNVLLRKKQYESINHQELSAQIVRNILFGKLRNGKAVLLRAARTEQREAVSGKLFDTAQKLSELAQQLSQCGEIDSMRGIEGAAASLYFARFDDMLSEKCAFRFGERSRRPPRNEVNAVLSFLYTILTRDVQAALETVGLDPAAGYLHTLRPGRPSLALDMLEELRAPLCDRSVLSLFNRGQLTQKDFEADSQAVMLNERGRKTVLTSWQKRKQEEITHPFLDEKIQIGMIPYAQAMLFARMLRGDLDCYPPFSWR
jgi:CRISPR-associated protein Cas1